MLNNNEIVKIGRNEIDSWKKENETYYQFE